MQNVNGRKNYGYEKNALEFANFIPNNKILHKTPNNCPCIYHHNTGIITRTLSAGKLAKYKFVPRKDTKYVPTKPTR